MRPRRPSSQSGFYGQCGGVRTYLSCCTCCGVQQAGEYYPWIRDNEARVRFGYNVRRATSCSCLSSQRLSRLLLVRFTILRPGSSILELAPIASIYLAVWVAIGGRGRLYGAVIGAAFVSLLSSYFTGGQALTFPSDLPLCAGLNGGSVLLGLSFVAVTLYAPKGLAGLLIILIVKGASDGSAASR